MTGFDTRQTQRLHLLKMLIFALQAVAFAYIAMHVVVSWTAYRVAGALSAVLTLLSLGFGDLYWAVEHARTLGAAPEAILPGIAAGVCFTSWLARPAFDRWAARYTQGMLADTADELQSLLREATDGESSSVCGTGSEPPPGPER